jgi:uncharacterized protein (DUF1800 family)
MNSEQRKINHLLWRAGFGPVAQNHLKNSWSLQQWIERLTDKNNDRFYLDYSDKAISALQKKSGMEWMERAGNKLARRILFIGTNYYWLQTMIESKNDLHERMTLFWAGIFACQNLLARQGEDYINTIREHALGKFPDLLNAVSKHPSMLRFLNNQQNRKQHPNENFAREVMELFTLGRGNYTEKDVREAARAFTGWGFNDKGEFVFRKQHHDFGEKEFLGQKGNFTGDDILRIIISQKQCARYLCRRIYRHFVNDNEDEKIIELLAERFYNSGYDIHDLIKHIFSSEWFYDDKNIGIKVKPPVVLLVNLSRQFNIRFSEHGELLRIQRILGQVLLFPPNVSGWPEGKNWIDSSTLLYRLNLPSMLLKASNIPLNAKKEFDAQLSDVDVSEQDRESRVKIISDTRSFEQSFQGMNSEEMKKQLAALLLQTGNAANILSNWKENYDTATDAALYLMSLPEYQLC